VLVKLPAGVTARAFAAGENHSLAIGSDGKLYAWGWNNFGQLGIGSTDTDRPTPVVVTLSAGVTPTAIAAGSSHNLAIGSDGVLYSWGYNFSGQLGDGSANFPYYNTTLQAVSLPTGVTATNIAAGGSHSLAIGSDGNLYAWGSNQYGQLGNTSAPSQAHPVPQAVNLPTGTTPAALSAGSEASHSLAILTSAPAVTASQTGTSDGTQANASVGGTGPNTPGSYAATASGTAGSVTVAQYAGNPAAGTPPPNGANYFDVKVSPGNTFTSVQIVDCNLGAGNTIYWYTGAAWTVASPVSPNTPTAGCATLTVSSTSSPNLSQLTGTPFASGTSSGPTSARVSDLHVTRHAASVVIHWRAPVNQGLRGFNLDSGGRRLNRRMIPMHSGTAYRYVVHAPVTGRIVLLGMLADGRVVRLAHS